MDPRAALSQLPPCATTGIGSLPPLLVDEAIALSLQQDVPYLPELPGLGAQELMIPSALRGCTLDPEAPSGASGKTTLIEQAFFGAVQRRAPRLAKAQLAGPATVTRFTRTPAGARVADVPDLTERVVEHLAAKAARLARSLRQANVTPMIFLDEPGLGMDELPAAALERVRRAAHDEGAVVGVHCCGQTRWPELLGLGFDVISLDARLSLDAALEDRGAWLRFLEAGGTLCLGIIPTSGARYDLGELCDSVEASLRATTPRFEQVLSRMLLSPACGLGLHPLEDAGRISAEVRAAQARLRSLL